MVDIKKKTLKYVQKGYNLCMYAYFLKITSLKWRQHECLISIVYVYFLNENYIILVNFEVCVFYDIRSKY